MSFSVEIPYGAYWSTPFAKWQGTLSNLHSVRFAAHVAKQELERREIAVEVFDFGVLGITTPQQGSFYGLPWLTGMIGAGHVSGPTISQACATAARCMLTATQEIETGLASCALTVACERHSNSPHIYYPNPKGPGGYGITEDFALDNMTRDPLGQHSMLTTAENVAAKHHISTGQQHELVLRREEQYRMALENDRAFQRKYMTLPFDVPSPDYRRIAASLDGDEGVMESTPEGLAALKPILEDGTVTAGGQTHPGDGNAAMVITTPERAGELSTNPNIAIRILGFGLARVELGYMPEAPIPAAKMALESGNRKIEQVDAIKTHNPFAVNDLVFASETKTDAMEINNYGCSLVWGHPSSATGLRSVIELIEELVMRGGGLGLFTGCAAGDSAMAVLIEVADR